MSEITALSEITDLEVELHADVGLTFTGSTVTGWADQSGNGKNATVSAGTWHYRPGPKAAVFATADSSQITIGSVTTTERDSTTFAVLQGVMSVKRTADAGATNRWSLWTGANELFIAASTDGDLCTEDNGSTITFTGVKLPCHPTVVCLRSNASNGYDLWIDGIRYTTASGSDTDAGSDILLGYVASGNVGSFAEYSSFAHYSRTLTDAEVAQVSEYLTKRWGLHRSHSATRIVWMGDSISLGAGEAGSPLFTGRRSFIQVIRETIDADHYVLAQGGAYIDGNTGNEVSEWLPEAQALYQHGAKSVAVVYAGTNDLHLSSATAATTYARLESLCNSLRGYGYQVVVVGTLPRGGNTAGQNKSQDFNTLLRADHSFADAFVDIYLDDRIGGYFGNVDNATYYGTDSVHPSNAGHRVLAELIAGGLAEVGILSPLHSIRGHQRSLVALPNAAAAGTGGLPTADANNRIAGIVGTITTLDALDTAQDTQHTSTLNAVGALGSITLDSDDYDAIGAAAAAAIDTEAIAEAVIEAPIDGSTAGSIGWALEGSLTASQATLTAIGDVDNKLGSPANNNQAEDIAQVKAVVDAILVDTGTTLPWQIASGGGGGGGSGNVHQEDAILIAQMAVVAGEGLKQLGSPLELTVGDAGLLVAADFARDLRAQGKKRVADIVSVEVVSWPVGGSEDGISFDSPTGTGVDHTQAKFAVDANAAGEYTVRLTVTYANGSGNRVGDIDFVVRA